jgi:hypothetical protein
VVERVLPFGDRTRVLLRAGPERVLADLAPGAQAPGSGARTGLAVDPAAARALSARG